MDEFRGEKVDIVRWSDDSAKYVASALSPAKVGHVTIDETTRSAMVVAPDTQLSLAIGREGQNVRLAARLTGWRIDIRSESQLAQAAADQAQRAGGRRCCRGGARTGHGGRSRASGGGSRGPAR